MVRNPVVRVVVRRLYLAVPLLFVVSALSFLLSSLAPTNVLDVLLPNGSPAQYVALAHRLGLDQPVYEQYWHWLVHALGGNLGTSYTTGQGVKALIVQRFPVTLSLVVPTVVVMFVVGVGAGVVSAVHGGAVGRLIDSLTLVGFALAGVLGGCGPGVVLRREDPLASGYRVCVVGAVAGRLGTLDGAAGRRVVAAADRGDGRQTREAMMDVLASEHVRMAWANGIPPRVIFLQACAQERLDARCDGGRSPGHRSADRHGVRRAGVLAAGARVGPRHCSVDR
jgi:peptide/nickel transport system permease protein